MLNGVHRRKRAESPVLEEEEEEPIVVTLKPMIFGEAINKRQIIRLRAKTWSFPSSDAMECVIEGKILKYNRVGNFSPIKCKLLECTFSFLWLD